MDTLKNPSISFTAMSVFAALTVTVFLFIILSGLSNMERVQKTENHHAPFFIPDTRPPKPPEPVKENEVKQRELVQEMKKLPPKYHVTPELRTINPATGIAVTVRPELKNQESIQIPPVRDVYHATQVDRIPTIARSVNPVYPFSAQNSGIEGRVVLRFVVDEEGIVQNPEVVQAEPRGVFEESALAAIEKYRFRPALIDGKPVKCLVVQHIGFRLNR